MTIDLSHARLILSLDLWRGAVTLDPLAGGITNHNYRVTTPETSYAARLCVPREVLGIDRRNEAVCQREAHRLGVAPGIVRLEDGVLVTEFLSARTLDAAGVREPSFLPRLAALLRALHDGWDRLNGEILYFSAFQTVRTYAASARELGARLPADIAGLVDDARALSRTVRPFVPVLCHNDLLPANILDDGRRVWLVDWEYAGVGHPMFDLAGVSANCHFTDAMDADFLAAYRGTDSADGDDLRTLRVFKAVSLLREALWSAIQTVTGEIAFDYAGYAETNFRAYREARERLGGG